jgi:hypothetical protein
MTALTYLDAEHGPRPVAGTRKDDRLLLDPSAVTELTGWVLKPEGLCQGDVCVPVRDPDLTVDGALDAFRFAQALRRPAVVDAASGVVAIGERSAERRGPIEAGVAPDFTLPQVAGGTFRFRSLGRRKKLLLAWASW